MLNQNTYQNYLKSLKSTAYEVVEALHLTDFEIDILANNDRTEFIVRFIFRTDEDEYIMNYILQDFTKLFKLEELLKAKPLHPKFKDKLLSYIMKKRSEEQYKINYKNPRTRKI